MSEWWSYELSDFLLFSLRTYYRLFELYNREIWPGQLVALAAGIVLLALLRSPGLRQSRTAFAVLGASWLWVAWGYHYARYATINWVAPYFAMAFALEGILLMAIAVGRGLVLRPPAPSITWCGAGLVVFALAVQPLIGPLVGRPWSQAEVFGVAPDPTVVVTLGVLALVSGWRKRLLLAIPIVWCLVSGAIALAMRSPDAWVMPAAAALAFAASAASTGWRGRRSKRSA